MKKIFALILVVNSLTISASSFALDNNQNAQPVDPNRGGTLKGAAVGGLGGAAIGHPYAGAAVGAMVGHHRRKVARREAARQAKQAEHNPEVAPQNNTH